MQKILKETKCDAIKIENNYNNLNIVKAFKKSKLMWDIEMTFNLKNLCLIKLKRKKNLYI